MNPKERTALVFLVAVLLVGAGVAVHRRHVQARRLAASPIVVENPADTTDVDTGLLDLNRAKKYELEALPGIGPVLAGRIIDYRERHGGFSSVSELRNVAGIGPKRYAVLREMVTVGYPDSE